MAHPPPPLELRVIYGDTDQMGVVYYANYLRYFEAARGHFVRARGRSYKEFEAAGFALPVIEAHVKYRQSLRYDDLFAIRAVVAERKRVTGKFAYEITRGGEAIAEGQLATELDPTSLSIRRSFGWLHYYARRFDEACVHVERAVAMNPTADESYRVLALCQAMAGRWVDAEQSAREAVTMSAEGPYNRATLAYVLARSGQRAAAGRELAELESRARDGYVSPVSFATVHLGLENWDAALDWMERAHAERRGWMAYLRVNPIMDGLRGRTRFEALVRQMKL